MRIDARIPVAFSPTPAQPHDHVVAEGEDFSPEPLHEHGCACCTSRSQIGSLFGSLFFARARGQLPFFRRIVVRAASPAGRSAVIDAVCNDPVASACYRLDAPAASCNMEAKTPGAEAKED